jgi:hypothetical protein
VSPPNAPVHTAGFGLQPFNLSIPKSANILWRHMLRIAVSRDPQFAISHRFSIINNNNKQN